jgi:hypothetical protein
MFKSHVYHQYGEQIQYLDKLQTKIFTKRPLGQKERLQLSSGGNLNVGAASTSTTGGEVYLASIFFVLLVPLISTPIFG